MKRSTNDKDSKSKREKRYLSVFDDEAEEDDLDEEEEEAEEGYDIAKVFTDNGFSRVDERNGRGVP